MFNRPATGGVKAYGESEGPCIGTGTDPQGSRNPDETSAGKTGRARRGSRVPLDLSIRVSFGRAINPISGTNWEGTGVTPDIEIPSGLALDTAYIDALTKLRERDVSDDEAFALDWAIAGLKAGLNPVEVDAAALESYAGDYGPRHLRVEDGRLFYNCDGRDPIVATPMSETTFSFEAVPYFRLEVVLGDDGVPIKLVGHYDNGRTDENPRDQ